MEDYREFIGIEHLKTILSQISPDKIIKPAYENWIFSQKSGYTILNLETGEIKGIGIELNQMPLEDIVYIELYSIKFDEYPVEPEDLFNEEEYESYLDFSEDEACEYTPDIVSEFCSLNEIDENDRKIQLLFDEFLKKECFNYNQWESLILNKYFDKIAQYDEMHY